MAILKVLRDQVVKAFYGNAYVPKGLWELENYFRQYDGIEFKFEKNSEGLVAVSENFRFGSIITSGRTQEELDRNVKDAILTSFSIPSSFAKKVNIFRKGERRERYALA
ncbi:MAG: hypothetical protein AAB515_03220 [Patescibacteria group bacterium]